MRKLFILALAAFLVAAFTTPVLAETKVVFDGYYRARYFKLNNRNLTDQEEQEWDQGWFDHRYRLNAQFIPSDPLAVVLRIQGVNGYDWGVQEEHDFDIVRVYMQIKTPFGMFRVGRMSGGVSGLAAMGYAGSSYGETTSEVFDAEGPKWRLWWYLPAGNFSIAVVYEKILEQDNTEEAVADQDVDMLAVVPGYKWETGRFNVTLVYVRNRANPAVDQDVYIVQPAVIQNFGAFSFHFEFQYRTGTNDMVDEAADDTDIEGIGLYLDFLWNYGSGELGVQYMYVSGDDDPDDDTVGGATTAGADYIPFLIAYDMDVVAPYGGQTVYNQANHWMVGLWVDHNLTEEMMLHAAFAYIMIVEPGEDAAGDEIDDFFGYEFDFGIRWKLMENLVFYSLFGYFVPGGYLEQGMDDAEIGNAWAWKNVLYLYY